MDRDHSSPVDPRARGRLVAGRMRWGVLASEQAGFTLIEILITALIVVLISGAVAQALAERDRSHRKN